MHPFLNINVCHLSNQKIITNAFRQFLGTETKKALLTKVNQGLAVIIPNEQNL